MKKSMFLIAAAAISCYVFAADVVKPKRGRPRGSSRPSGGIVEKSYSGNIFKIINAQNSIDARHLANVAKKIRFNTLLPIEAHAGTINNDSCPFSAADKLVSESKVGAGLLIVENENLPLTLVAPERRWAILNISRLKADAPSMEKLNARFEKMLWCSVARALGAGYSSYKPCVLTPFKSLKELDTSIYPQLCPEPINKMIDTGKAYGIHTITIASYRTACQQGWAAQPTNAVQKAIWDEVHAMPTSPIKIKPEKKKVRE